MWCGVYEFTHTISHIPPSPPSVFCFFSDTHNTTFDKQLIIRRRSTPHSLRFLVYDVDRPRLDAEDLLGWCDMDVDQLISQQEITCKLTHEKPNYQKKLIEAGSYLVITWSNQSKQTSLPPPVSRLRSDSMVSIPEDIVTGT